jgi:hypothetical protein
MAQKQVFSCLVILCLLLPASVAAQRKGKPTSKKSVRSRPASERPPAYPIEVKLGYHRMQDKALFVTLKNEDKKRSIKAALCTVLVFDPITLKKQKSFFVKSFDFAVPISPGEEFTSVLTEESLSGLADNFVPGRCRQYDRGEKSGAFVPGACTQDALLISIDAVVFSDDSKWFSPELRPREAAVKSERNSRPVDFQSAKFSRAKVTKQEIGNEWPFTVGEGDIACAETTGALFFITQNQVYALNGIALDVKVDGKNVQLLTAIKLPEKNTSALIQKATELCQ